MSRPPLDVDLVICGGGVAGLWLLHEATARGYSAVLLERDALGSGQSVASQGIIHGGLKYALTGWASKSARKIREMPGLWRDALEGRSGPDLSGVAMRSDACHLWRTESLTSRLGFLAARLVLRVTPRSLKVDERPPLLRDCPGLVALLPEPVLAPHSMIRELARPHSGRVLHFDADAGIQFNSPAPGEVRSLTITDPITQQTQTFKPRTVVFTAGGGNAALCEQVGLTRPRMQRRPLHMVVLRGDMPLLNGHCVDGSKTRVTITSEACADGRTVWQLGGQIAELGVDASGEELVQHAVSEVRAVLPRLDLSGVEAMTYRVDRAEGVTASGRRPDDAFAQQAGNVVVGWPTKLALAPQLADRILDLLPRAACDSITLPEWTAPPVANYPWERNAAWIPVSEPVRKVA